MSLCSVRRFRMSAPPCLPRAYPAPPIQRTVTKSLRLPRMLEFRDEHADYALARCLYWSKHEWSGAERSMAQMSRLVWWLAWAPTLVVLLAAGPMVYFATANGETSLGDNVLSAWLILVFALMGSLIASRRPRNAVGWFLCLVALLAITGDLSIEYAVYGLARHPGALPGADWAALYGGISRSLGWFYMITLIPLYFPTGKLPSPRWRWIAWALLVTTAALLVSGAFGQTFTNSDNRLVGMRSPMPLLPDTIANGAFSLAALVMFGHMLCSVYAVAVRFLRARGTERQQLKWFVYAVAITAILGSFFGSVMFLSLKISLVGSIWYLATVGMPIAAGIAILRYRLYDIDIIINRTLVYGSLTAILAALYFGLVIGAQTLTRLLTGK